MTSPKIASCVAPSSRPLQNSWWLINESRTTSTPFAIAARPQGIVFVPSPKTSGAASQTPCATTASPLSTYKPIFSPSIVPADVGVVEQVVPATALEKLGGTITF